MSKNPKDKLKKSPVRKQSWLTANDRLRAADFRKKFEALTLEQLVAFLHDLHCVVDEVREYGCENEDLPEVLARQDGDLTHARWFPPSSPVAAEYATRATQVIADWLSKREDVPTLGDLDWLVDHSEVHRNPSSQRICDLLHFGDNGVPPYRAVPGKTQAANCTEPGGIATI